MSTKFHSHTYCNCTPQDLQVQLSSECGHVLRQILSQLDGLHVVATTTVDPLVLAERQKNADLFSIAILSLFASIILLLMVRAIKPSETLDDQVTNMLTSMRAKCEFEDDMRHKMKLKQAKDRAQKWLNDAKAKSISRVRKLSFRAPRSRAGSADAPRSLGLDSLSVKSQQFFPNYNDINYHKRAASFQFLPQIVVETAKDTKEATTIEIPENYVETGQETEENSRKTDLPSSSTQSLVDDSSLSDESVALDSFLEYSSRF